MLRCRNPIRNRLLFVVAAALVGACGRSSAPATSTTTAGVHVFVSDETGGDVVLVDPDSGQIVERIAVGKRPRGMKLSADGRQLFVALSGSPIGGPHVDESKLPPADRTADGIGVVDLTSRKVVRKYKSGQDPESFALSPDGKMLYVSNEDAAEMSVLDLTSGNVTNRVKVGEEPEGVTVRPDGREVYVTCEGDNEVVAIDTTSFAVVATMKTAARPRAVVFTPDGSTAFVTNENGGAVTVIDVPNHTVAATIKLPTAAGATVPPRPMGAVLSTDARQLFVSLGRAKSIAMIDVASRQLLRTIDEVGARPWGIGLSPDGKKLYTANGPAGDVSVVDIETGKVDRRIAVGGGPWGVAVVERR
jgi:YVTN family beta-propeller protein